MGIEIKLLTLRGNKCAPHLCFLSSVGRSVGPNTRIAATFLGALAESRRLHSHARLEEKAKSLRRKLDNNHIKECSGLTSSKACHMINGVEVIRHHKKCPT